jgi:hypothetical protein
VDYTITEGVFFEVVCKTIDHEEYINSSHLTWVWDKLPNTENESVIILNRNEPQSQYKESTDGTLYILKTTSEDAGDYKCIVENDNGIDYRIISLNIRGITLLLQFE